MTQEAEKLRGFSSQQLGEYEGTVAEILYQCYQGVATLDNERIRENDEIIQKYTKGMAYEERDSICSAVAAIGAECERLAFLDGVAVGIRLILENVGDDVKKQP